MRASLITREGSALSPSLPPNHLEVSGRMTSPSDLAFQLSSSSGAVRACEKSRHPKLRMSASLSSSVHLDSFGLLWQWRCDCTLRRCTDSKADPGMGFPGFITSHSELSTCRCSGARRELRRSPRPQEARPSRSTTCRCWIRSSCLSFSWHGRDVHGCRALRSRTRDSLCNEYQARLLMAWIGCAHPRWRPEALFRSNSPRLVFRFSTQPTRGCLYSAIGTTTSRARYPFGRSAASRHAVGVQALY
jgi:hypothetical protein